MKYIMLKTFRDIRETIGSFISILIVIFIGCFFFAGIAEASTSVTNLVDDYCDAQKIASARASYMYVNSAAVDEVSAYKGVELAAGYDTFYAKAKSSGAKTDMTVTTLTAGIDEPYMVRGKLPRPGENEIIIDDVFADAHGVGVGETVEFEVNTLKKITVDVNGGQTQYTPEYTAVNYAFTVSGIYHSPDIIYKVNAMNTSASPKDFIMACVNYGEIKSYTDDAAVYIGDAQVFEYSSISPSTRIFNGIKIRGEVDDYEAVFKRYSVSSAADLQNIFQNPDAPTGLYMYSAERDNYPTFQAYDSINDTIAALAAVLPLIFFAVAAAITVISLTKTVDNQRTQIGVIQALGIGKGSVYFSYIFYALFACIIGGLAGGVVGTFTVPYLLLSIYSGQFSMPPMPLKIGVLYMFLGIIIAASLACVAAFLSCHRTLRVAPAQAMRPKPPKKTKRILAERWTSLWKKLGFGAKMNLRNMFLHKLRMLMSSVGIIGCLALLIGLIGLKDNMAFSFDRYDAQTGYDLTIVTSYAVNIEPHIQNPDGTVTVNPIYDEIANVSGVEYMHSLTFVPDFSARFEYKGRTADMTVMAIPTYADERDYHYADADCVKLYTDLRGNDRLVFRSDTFAIPESLADDLGVKKGDVVTVGGYTLDNKPIEFKIKITAVVCEYFDQKAYCSYDVFKNNGIGLYADKSYATVLPWESIKDAAKAIEGIETVRAAQTFRETYEALENQMSLLDYAVIIFVVGAAVLAVAVIYNITATNLKERTREIATLMVLGYKKRETANMIIVENMVITAIGCIIGLPLGYGLLVWLVNLTASFDVFISGFLSWYVSIGCVAMTFAFSLLATMFLNRKMKKISMVEALKSVE